MSFLTLGGHGLNLTFDHDGHRLRLTGMTGPDGRPYLHADPDAHDLGAGRVGNPLALFIRQGPRAGSWDLGDFRVLNLEADDRSLLAYCQHDTLPLLFALQVSVDGQVATWRGQIGWNGDDAVDLEAYFPLLSRLIPGDPAHDRALFPHISGSVQGPLGEVNYRQGYLGGIAAPCFFVDGGERGIAFLDDNRADFSPDPGACVFRSYVVGNRLPLDIQPRDSGGADGPFAGICHVRRFRPASEVGAEFIIAEDHRNPPPLQCSGDLVDLGPVRTCAYEGDWRQGAEWVRNERRHVPFRVSPADWYRRTTFIAEHNAEDLLRSGQSFHALPDLLDEKRRMGADLFHLYGFHNPEVLGAPRNMINRGDYLFAADNLGGPKALRRGIEATHRRGGRVLFYVEGLIVWKRSRIGRSRGQEWALQNADGSYVEHYKGFWHMCPSCAGWREWLAETCAELVRDTGVDGFFIDSSCATDFHRCFNADHRHPHPDVWNWGMRRLLREVREAVDRVNPETILFVEGGADMAREFADGFIAHSHDWNRMTFTEPVVRFLHPDQRAYESWGNLWNAEPGVTHQALHLFNAVHGHRIYAHQPGADLMGERGRVVRRAYDAFPEICDSPMSPLAVKAAGGIADLFEGPPPVVTVGNPTDAPVTVRLSLPLPARSLLDRVTDDRLVVTEGAATVPLAPWGFRAFELRR